MHKWWDHGQFEGIDVDTKPPKDEPPHARDRLKIIITKDSKGDES